MAGHKMDTFEYSPLKSHHSIRLLNVFGTNIASSQVECEVLEISLAESLENFDYEAISYA